MNVKKTYERKKRSNIIRRSLFIFIIICILNLILIGLYRKYRCNTQLKKELSILVANKEESKDNEKRNESQNISLDDLLESSTIKSEENNKIDIEKDNEIKTEEDIEMKSDIEKEESLNNPLKYLSLEDDNNADDASIVLSETMYKWNFYREDNKKIAYLTFDDGPSINNTEKILDILNYNDVKATFFVLGSSIDNNSKSKYLLERIVNEGHSLGSHGYSHDYSKLYPNRQMDVKAIIEDFNNNDKILKSILGEEFESRIIRLPGGSSSWSGKEELDSELLNRNLWQVDWNSLNGDAESNILSTSELLSRLKETVSDQDVAIILMHDTDQKNTTVESLQSSIDYLKSEGFEFRTLK